MQITNFIPVYFHKNTISSDKTSYKAIPYKNYNNRTYQKNYYPKEYYISFLGKSLTLEEQMKKLTQEQLPSSEISKLADEAILNKDNKTIYDIHSEVYARLKECKTLDEAKALYPEFKNVIDAKDLNITKSMRVMTKIKNGEIEGLSIDNLSLTFLKKFYVELAGVSDKSKWFGITSAAIYNIAETLNIKKIRPQIH